MSSDESSEEKVREAVKMGREVYIRNIVQGVNRNNLESRKKLLTPLLQRYAKAGNEAMVAYLQSVCSVEEQKKEGFGFEY